MGSSIPDHLFIDAALAQDDPELFKKVVQTIQSHPGYHEQTALRRLVSEGPPLGDAIVSPAWMKQAFDLHFSSSLTHSRAAAKHVLRRHDWTDSDVARVWRRRWVVGFRNERPARCIS